MRLALTLGVRDYVEKNGFSATSSLRSRVVRLGGDRRPLRRRAWATASTRLDRRGSGLRGRVELTPRWRRTSAGVLAVPIEDVALSFRDALAGEIEGGLEGLAAENLRPPGARAPASCSWRSPTPTAGWSSRPGTSRELAVGYSTLSSGIWLGGFAAVPEDVFNDDVYRLAEPSGTRRPDAESLPRSTIERAPSAELRDDQRDADLDPAVRPARSRPRGVRRGGPLARGARRGVRPAVVERAVALVDRAEYKRRQAPPGLKLRPKAFGRDRRTPITEPLPGLSYRSASIGALGGPRSARSRTSAGSCQRREEPLTRLELVQRPPARLRHPLLAELFPRTARRLEATGAHGVRQLRCAGRRTRLDSSGGGSLRCSRRGAALELHRVDLLGELSPQRVSSVSSVNPLHRASPTQTVPKVESTRRTRSSRSRPNGFAPAWREVARSPDELTQFREPAQALAPWHGGVRGRRRGKDEERRGPESPRPQTMPGPLPEDTVIRGLADEADRARSESLREFLEALARACEVRGPQVARAARRPARRVGEPDP